MHGGTLDIDAIVREVVARLAAASSSLREPATSASPVASNVVAPNVVAPNAVAKTADSKSPVAATTGAAPSEPSADVSLLGSVVTVDLLARQVPAGARRILVAPRAVVTPAARDWLRARSLELVRVAATATAATTAKSTTLGKFYLHGTLPHVASTDWTQRIAAAGWELEKLVPCPARQAAAELAAVLGPTNRLGLLLTRETLSAACLANRFDNVRAAEATNVEGARAAVREIHANLLIVDPTRAGPFVLKQMTQEFLRVGPRDAPAAWRASP